MIAAIKAITAVRRMRMEIPVGYRFDFKAGRRVANVTRLVHDRMSVAGEISTPNSLHQTTTLRKRVSSVPAGTS